jgi:heat shock protein HslJ
MKYATAHGTGLLICLSMLGGCTNNKAEEQPTVDTRPMVSEIRQAEQDWAWVSGERWVLSTIEGQAPIAKTELTLNFREHTWLEGSSGCNRYTASYIRKAEAGLHISEIISTRMFCTQPGGIMQQESRFFHLLQQIDAYHAEPHRLDLLSDGAVVLSFGITPASTDAGDETP